MRIHWYTAAGFLIDTRWPKSVGEAHSLARLLSGLIGFAVLETADYKTWWFKKGRLVFDPVRRHDQPKPKHRA